jgi:hypothetical protein
MTMPKNDKYKDYARYAEHCLNMVAATTDQKSRSIQREMAAEWPRLADAIRRGWKPPRRSAKNHYRLPCRRAETLTPGAFHPLRGHRQAGT